MSEKKGKKSHKHDFRVLSDRRCSTPSCRKQLKQNLVDKSPDADKCWKCYQRLVKKNPSYMTEAERQQYNSHLKKLIDF